MVNFKCVFFLVFLLSSTVFHTGAVASINGVTFNTSPTFINTVNSAPPSQPITPSNLLATVLNTDEIQLKWQYDGPGLKVVVIGSSTAEGIVGPTPGNGFVDLLRNWLALSSPGSTVINYGKGGYTTRHVMPTGSSPTVDAARNITKALSDNPDIIIVSLPSNDAVAGISLTESMANFKVIKNAAIAQGVPLYLTTTQPRNANMVQRELLRETAIAIRSEFGVDVIDIYDELTDFVLNLSIKQIYHYGDNIHLNNAGHQYIFHETKAKVLPYVNTFEIHRSLLPEGPFTWVGTTNQLSFNDTGLDPATIYYYRISANSNFGSSEFTTAISATTLPDYYYAKSSGDLNQLSTWGKQLDGGGPYPIDFTGPGKYLEIRNRTLVSLSSPWGVTGNNSRIIVRAGTTLTCNEAVDGKVEVNGTLILHHTATPEILSTGIGSSVSYNLNARIIQQVTYHHLVLTGGDEKVLAAGTTIVNGNVTISSGALLAGIEPNAATLQLNGDLIFEGGSAGVPGNMINLAFAGGSVQTINSSFDLHYNTLEASGSGTVVQFLPATPSTIFLGSSAGGGLALGEGSKFNLGSNTLICEGHSFINPNNETGMIQVNNGNIEIQSTSNLNSNLYFDEDDHTVKKFTIAASGNGDVIMRSLLYISEALKVKRGELHANGFITLGSDETQTANLLEIENDGLIMGDVTVQRYLEQKGRHYRYLSAGVEGATVADWKASFPITGTFEGASTSAALSSDPSLFYYQEPVGYIPYPDPEGLSPTNTLDAPIEKGRGYAAFIRKVDGATLVETTGVPNQGVVTFPMHGNGGPTGWNLLGNPYASTIKWSTDNAAWLNLEHVNSMIAVRNNSGSVQKFMYYDAATGLGTEDPDHGLLNDGLIASGQAFWVRAIVSNPDLKITEKAKSTSQQSHYRKEIASHIKVNLTDGLLTDATIIAFTEFGTDAYDPRWDGIKQSNVGMFNLSTVVEENIYLAINNTASIFCDKIITLAITNAKLGKHIISIEGIETMDNLRTLLLHDAFTKADINLQENNHYEFIVTEDSASFDSRFSITVISNAANTPVITVRGDTLVSSFSGKLQWYKDGEMIANEHGNKFVPVVSGNYSVAPLNGRCQTISEDFYFLVTASDTDTDKGLALFVYPNPAQSQALNIQVNSQSTEPFTITIVDMLGHVSFKEVYVLKNKQSIQPQVRLATGLYFITLQQKGVVLKKKLMIQN